MFSRSEKTDEVHDAMTEQPAGQRSPMVLAALAGLLAIAGAFLLVWYLSNGSDDSVADGAPVVDQADATQATSQVLIATKIIPRGTSISELIEAPTVYLSADVVDESTVIASAINTVGDLNELVGQTLASDVLPGEQLLRSRFRNPAEFDPEEETFLEATTKIPTPDGHHAVVIELPANRALGGNFRAGETVTVVATFRLNSSNAVSITDTAVTVLNSVEVLAVVNSLEVAGAINENADQVGVANRGSYTVTLAVEPDELTDLAYALEFGDIVLATAVPNFENEGNPRAVTTIAQIVGDDGVWLKEFEDGNVFNLIGFLLGEESVFTPSDSIEIEIDGDDVTVTEEEGDEESAALVVDDDDEAGDS